MEKSELIMLGACSLLSRKEEIDDSDIQEMVEIAHDVWEETLKQERER